MTDQAPETSTSTEPATGKTPAAGGDDLDARISAAVDARLDKAVEARLAPLTSKYNKELAGLRKKLEGRSETQRTEGEDGEAQAAKPNAATGLTREDLKAYGEIAKLRERLGDAADDVDAEDSEEPYAMRLLALRAADKIHSRARAAADAEAKAEPKTEKPGRDARTNGSQRGHAPAPRTPDGYPATFEAWDALPIEKKRDLRTQFPDRVPRLLPRTTRA